MGTIQKLMKMIRLHNTTHVYCLQKDWTILYQ